MKHKRILALLLTAALALQGTSALAAMPTGVSAVKSRTTISSNSAQTAEALSLNVQKAYTFTDSDSERYYKFTPSTTGYYEVKVENAVCDDFAWVYDSTGTLVDAGNCSSSFATAFTTNGIKMTAGQTYFIYVCAFVDSGASRPVCTTVVKHTHTTDDLLGTQEADCIEAGYKEYHCSKCMDTYQIAIPKKGHSWKSTYTVDKKATCTQAGQKSIHCSVCNAVKSGSSVSIPALGHSYKESYRIQADQNANGRISYMCDRCYAEKTTTIPRPKKITLSKTTYVYDGIAKKPTVKVTDAAGKTISASNYTVSYAAGRKVVGSYKVRVEFHGSQYEGALSTYFTIIPQASTLKSVTASSKGFTAKWTKVSAQKGTTQSTGFHLQCSTSSKFTKVKNVLIQSTKTTSKKVTGLSPKKKYYVRIRTYKETISGKRYYSNWSKVKTVTTKK